MIATVYAPALIGISGQLVTIECDITNGLPGLVIVGLGDKAVEESRERIRSAIKNSGFALPAKRITLNLSPADLPKDGSGYDLGMALGILCASGQLSQTLVENRLFLGELALNGSINSTRGALIAAQVASQHQFESLFVPQSSAEEACLVDEPKIFTVTSLLEAYHHLSGQKLLSPARAEAIAAAPTTNQNHIPDMSEIYGQYQAKRAVEIATAGGHNILLYGPPGTGKTLLAKSILKLLPRLTIAEAVEITKIYSLAENSIGKLMFERPFRSPHHTASSVALIGGGSRPKPGEISLSHGGVLLLDEMPEFPRPVLEVLRQPLEEGRITISRAAGSITFPARFMLVGTANPCPCGFLGDTNNRCQCQPAAIARYQRRLSGPLLDRIDLSTEVNRLEQSEILSHHPAQATSQEIAHRIQAARKIQTRRFSEDTGKLNAHMSNKDIQIHCTINNEIKNLASLAMNNLGLSVRGYMRCLRVARTIADLDSSKTIEVHHFTEALQYRPKYLSVKKSEIPTVISDFDKAINAFSKGRIAQNVPQ